MTMQCPLCQAEGSTEGFFCSQSCFAKNWLSHRDSMHKKGVVKEKKRTENEERQKRIAAGEITEEDAATSGKKLKKKAKKEKPAEAVAPHALYDGRWKDLPSGSQCSATKTGIIQPTLSSKKMAPRVVVAVKNSTAAGTTAPTDATGVSPFAAPAALQQTVATDDAKNCSATSLWSAAVAAAHLLASSASTLNMTDNQVVIVAGSAVSAFAAAWALKSAGGIASSQMELVLSADKDQIAVGPNDRANKAPIRIVTVAVLAAIGSNAAAASSSASLDAWLGNKLMITLPDVRRPADLQTMTTRAVFFILEKSAAAAANEEKKEDAASPSKKVAGKKRNTREEGAEDEDEEALAPTHSVACLATGLVPCPNTVFPISTGKKGASLEDIIGGEKDADIDGADEEKKDDDEEELTAVEAEERKIATHRRFALCGLHDDTLVHLLNRNDLLQLITHLRALYNTLPNKKFVETVANALIADRGGDLLFAQHKFAMILWMSVVAVRATGSSDQSHNFIQTLAKCVIRAAGTFPIHVTALPKAKNRFISLQACLTFLHGTVNEALLDQLAALWDIDEFILGYSELSFMDGHRRDIVRRLNLNYAIKLENGVEHVKMLVILYHLACNLCAKYTINVSELALITQWNVFFAFHFGALNTFIATAELTAGNGKTGHAASLLSRKSKKEQAADVEKTTISAAAAALTPTTFLKPAAHQQNLPFTKCPVHLRHQIQNDAMARAAVDEILSAMPKVPIPMFIGDVGQLIGIWPRFNARFGGKLGYKLSEFLERWPDKFRILGNLVTRLQESVSEPIRIRFDNEIEEDSDDEGTAAVNGSKRRTKITAGAGGKTLHRKAIRRQALKERNKTRYNKNHQQFDPSAKVPGYTKPKPRKVKGRGKKANIRNYKRGA